MKSHKVFFGAALAALLVACGPSKPTGSEYLGKWEADSITYPGKYVCQLDIAKQGESFLITTTFDNNANDDGGAICEGFRGMFTLSPEGNLKGYSQRMMSSVVIFLDKVNNRVGVSSSGGNPTYLRKR